MYLVFDVGGTFIKFALMDKNGEIEETGKFPTQLDKYSRSGTVCKFRF